MLVVVLLFALVAAACGGDDDDTGGAEAEPEADPDGVVRWGQDLVVNGGWCFDPTTTMKSNQFFTNYAIYDGLLELGLDGEYEPSLAEKVEILDNQTIEITLREGLKFSDGTALDAVALKATIDRNRASKNGQALDLPQLARISSVTTRGDTVVTIGFSQPNATLFYPLLAKLDTAPVSPAAVSSGADLCRAPVGAGPFRVTSFEPGSKVVLERNPHYHRADEVKLAGMEIIHVDLLSASNALRSGAVDLMPIGYDTVSTLADPLVADIKPAVGNIYMNVCMQGKPPLDSVKFRQALNYAVDREAINEAVFGGESEPAWGMWPSSHPYYNPDLEEHYAYDVDKAKQLLAEAGYANGAQFDLIVPPTTNSRKVMEIAQQQWAKIGVTANFVPSSNASSDFFVAVKYPAHAYANAYGGVNKISVSHQSGSLANVCKLQVPQIDRIITEIGQLGPDEQDEVADHLRDAAEIIVADLAWGVQFVFDTDIWAYNDDRVGGLAFHQNAINLRHPIWRELYIKA